MSIDPTSLWNKLNKSTTTPGSGSDSVWDKLNTIQRPTQSWDEYRKQKEDEEKKRQREEQRRNAQEQINRIIQDNRGSLTKAWDTAKGIFSPSNISNTASNLTKPITANGIGKNNPLNLFKNPSSVPTTGMGSWENNVPDRPPTENDWKIVDKMNADLKNSFSKLDKTNPGSVDAYNAKVDELNNKINELYKQYSVNKSSMNNNLKSSWDVAPMDTSANLDIPGKIKDFARAMPRGVVKLLQTGADVIQPSINHNVDPITMDPISRFILGDKAINSDTQTSLEYESYLKNKLNIPQNDKGLKARLATGVAVTGAAAQTVLDILPLLAPFEFWGKKAADSLVTQSEKTILGPAKLEEFSTRPHVDINGNPLTPEESAVAGRLQKVAKDISKQGKSLIIEHPIEPRTVPGKIAKALGGENKIKEPKFSVGGAPVEGGVSSVSEPNGAIIKSEFPISQSEVPTSNGLPEIKTPINGGPFPVSKSEVPSVLPPVASTSVTPPQSFPLSKADITKPVSIQPKEDALTTEARKYKSADEFVNKFYTETTNSLQPGLTILSDTSETGLYHGAGQTNLKSILESGRIRTNTSKLDKVGEKTVSATGNRSVADSYGTVFELDDTIPKRKAPKGTNLGDNFDGFEYRIDSDIPLSKVKSVTLHLNKAEGLDTKIMWDYSGKNPEYISAKELKKLFEEKGIKVFTDDGSVLSSKSQLTDIWNKANAKPEQTPSKESEVKITKDMFSESDLADINKESLKFVGEEGPELESQYKKFKQSYGKFKEPPEDIAAWEKLNPERSDKLFNSTEYTGDEVYDMFKSRYEAEKGTSKTITLQGGIPAISEFVEQDIIPAFKTGTRGFIESVYLIKSIFAPRSGADSKAVDAIMTLLGERNKYDFLLEKTTKMIEKMFSKMSQEDQIAFVDRVKDGEAQPNPELQSVADMMREIDTANWEKANEFKAEVAWKENHYRVLWKKIPGSVEQKGFAGIFKKPLQGTKGFFKQSTLSSMSEGIAMGGVPFSYNPMTMFVAAQADMMKYITAQKWMADARDRGSMQFIAPGKPIPEGKALVDDRLSHIYMGAGRLVIDAAEAKLLNNYLGRDIIREHALGRGLVYLKNLTTSVELAASPFHAIFETIETSGSSIGLGLQKIFNQGQIYQGGKDIVTAPLSPYSTAKLGGAVIRYLSKGDVINDRWVQKLIKQYPELDQIIEDLFTGGAKLQMHEDYRNQTSKTFMENVGNGNYIGATLRVLPAVNEQIMRPLFDAYIPRLKIGTFIKEYSFALVDNNKALVEGKITREELARKTWDFVEDRFGEMNWDNLFWNKTFKTAMQIMFRSTTWKMGNLRASGGAFYSQTREFYDAVREFRRPKLSSKMAWFLGMSIATAVISTVVQYLSIGEMPKEAKDFVFPRVDKDGTRVSTPSYWRDIIALKRGPTKYIEHSLSGFIGKMLETWENKDYYGNQVYNDRDPSWKQVMDAGINFIPKPFSVTNYLSSEGNTKDYGFFGFTKAPQYITNTPIQNEIYDLFNKRFGGGTKSEFQTEKSDISKNYKELIKEGKLQEARDVQIKAIKEGYYTARGFGTINANMIKGTDRVLFDRLPLDDKKYLLDKMNQDEKNYYLKTKKTSLIKSTSDIMKVAELHSMVKDLVKKNNEPIEVDINLV